MTKRWDLLTSKETIDYLQVSQHKFRKLMQEEILVPYAETKGRFGSNAYLFAPQDLIKVKKILAQEHYHYMYA